MGKHDITSKIIKHRLGLVRPMTADLVVLVSCPLCEQSEHIDLELTDDIFTWECAYCKSEIESTIRTLPVKKQMKGTNDMQDTQIIEASQVEGMGRCRTCAFWGDPIKHYHERLMPSDGRIKFCTCPKFHGVSNTSFPKDTDVALYSDVEGCEALFKTASDFGCVYWKSIERSK